MVRNGVFTYINGIPATLTFNGNTFYYVVNGQGDVTGITDSSGNLQISYYYDAWGNSSYTVASGAEYASTLLTINPLLYRGYVLDREVGMYYLQSRYYIPEIGRFINADGLVSTGQGILGNNMFAYCGNNPVCRSDPSGCFFGGSISAIISELDAAFQMLFTWLYGDGSNQVYGKGSPVVEALKESPKMQSIINEEIKSYKETGADSIGVKKEVFTSSDGANIYLAVGACNYKIDVSREFRLGFSQRRSIQTGQIEFVLHVEERYVASVIVFDLYNFDAKKWEGLGNIMNNIARLLHKKAGVGRDYYWQAGYTYRTTWQRVD